MINNIKQNNEKNMNHSVTLLKSNLSKIRTSRANISLLEHIQINYYNNLVPISQVASITLIDSHTIIVRPWEKHIIYAIEKAIRTSDLDLYPTIQQECIRINIPSLTEERRYKLVKIIKNEGEEAKISIRNLRRDSNEKLKKLSKEKEISKDDEHRFIDEIQKITNIFISKINKIIQDKEHEIMEV